MGIDFRNGRYTRRVNIGKRTVKDGEAVAIWNINGKHTQIIGPARVWLWFSTIRFLDRYRANDQEYVIIQYKDGTKEHKRGPFTIYLNPVFHEKIEVKPMMHLKNENEILVVYKDISKEEVEETYDEKNNKNDANEMELPNITKNKHQNIIKSIVKGPALFMPNVNEWLHEFKWNKISPYILKTNHQLWKFEALATTRDKFNITVKLTFQYILEDLTKVPDDLFNDLGNSALSDINTITNVNADQINSLMEPLKDLNSFPQLIQSSKNFGIRIDEVILREIIPDKHLKEHFSMVAKEETKLKIIQMKLQDKEVERQKEQMRLEQQQNSQQNALSILQKLHEWDVDLTKVLCAQAKSSNSNDFVSSVANIPIQISNKILEHYD